MTKQEWESYKKWVQIELAAAENDKENEEVLDGVKFIIGSFIRVIDVLVCEPDADPTTLDSSMAYVSRITTQLLNHVLTSPIVSGPDENSSEWEARELDYLESVRLSGLFYDKNTNRFTDINRIVCRGIDVSYQEDNVSLPDKIDNIVAATVENWFPLTLPYYPERLYVYVSCACYYADNKELTPAKILINKIVKHDANGQAHLCYNWTEEMKKPEKDRIIFCGAFDFDGNYKGQISTDEFMNTRRVDTCKKEDSES